MSAKFRITVRVRNNRLIEARESMGLSQKAACDAAGISQGVWGDYERIQASPISTARGEYWKPSARRIAEFLCVSPDDLWPEAIIEFKTPVSTIKTDGPPALDGNPTTKALETAEEADVIRAAMVDLTEREQKALSLRFGLGDADPKTLREVGQELGGRSVERTRQIVERALGKLRRKARASGILDVTPEDDAPKWCEGCGCAHENSCATYQLRSGTEPLQGCRPPTPWEMDYYAS